MSDEGARLARENSALHAELVAARRHALALQDRLDELAEPPSAAVVTTAAPTAAPTSLADELVLLQLAGSIDGDDDDEIEIVVAAAAAAVAAAPSPKPPRACTHEATIAQLHAEAALRRGERDRARAHAMSAAEDLQRLNGVKDRLERQALAFRAALLRARHELAASGRSPAPPPLAPAAMENSPSAAGEAVRAAVARAAFKVAAVKAAAIAHVAASAGGGGSGSNSPSSPRRESPAPPVKPPKPPPLVSQSPAPSVSLLKRLFN